MIFQTHVLKLLQIILKAQLHLPHSYGRLQFGADLDLHFRTMIGTGCNPNVAAVIVIGIEPKWTKKIVDGIAKTGKTCRRVSYRAYWRYWYCYESF